MLTNLTVVNISQYIHVSSHLQTLNLHHVRCQLYLNKAWKKNESMFETYSFSNSASKSDQKLLSSIVA